MPEHYAAVLKSLLAILLCCVFTNVSHAQPVNPADTVEVSAIKLSLKLRSSVLWYHHDVQSISPEQIASLPFRDTIPLAIRRKITASLVQQDVYLKFNVRNTDDTSITCYFLPGYFFRRIDLFKLSGGDSGAALIPDTSGDPMGYRKIIFAPKEISTIFAHLQFVKTSVNSLDPDLVRDYYLDSFITRKKSEFAYLNIITFVFSGILLMMILYSIAVAFRNRSREFLLYACYACCLGLMLFLKSYLFKSPSSFYYFFEGYLDFVMQSFGTMVYLSFLRTFINAKKGFPFIYDMFRWEQIFIGFSILAFSYYYFFTNNYLIQDAVENWSKYIWSACALVFIVYAFRRKNKMLNYLALGHSILLVCGLMSLYLIVAPAAIKNHLPRLLQSALIYYELGSQANWCSSW